jgi:hypothetical protein
MKEEKHFYGSKGAVCFPRNPLKKVTRVCRLVYEIILRFSQYLVYTASKNSIVWDITPCSPLKVNRLFGGTHHFHLKDRKIRQPASRHFLPWLILRPLRWKRHVHPKGR